MPPPSFSEAFLIMSLNKNGRADSIIPYYTDTATYVGVSISLCRGMLGTQMVKDAFYKFSDNYNPQIPKSQADFFIEKITEKFPIVFVDYSLTNPDIAALHIRRRWDVEKEFNTREQSIIINGPRVAKMVSAGIRAEKSKDKHSPDQKRFRVYLFTLAKSLLHEVGHLFITFLGKGQFLTPPNMIDLEGPMARNSHFENGEAGQHLEFLVFGGRVYILRNPEEDEDQAGLCYLLLEDGSFQILQETIDDFVRYKFDLPISRVGDKAKPSMKTLGSGQPLIVPFGNPMRAPETHWLLGTIEANQSEWDKAIHDLIAANTNLTQLTEDHYDIMRAVPFEPGRRIVEKANA